MNVLFLFVSLPEIIDDNSLFGSLITEFHKNGHKVYVSTRSKNNITTYSTENGIDILRIKSHEFTGVTNNIKKALAYQEYAIKQTFLVKKHFNNKKIDLIISHSLPPELAFEIFCLKKLFKCKFYLLQTDFTWQDAVAYGYFAKNSLIGLYYRFWEKQLFNLSDYIGCPTQGNVNFILSEYPHIQDNKFKVIDFWGKYKYVKKVYSIKEKFGLKEKFIAIYGGSVGAAQKLEHLIDLADSCKDKTDIVFLILGRGPQLQYIMHLAEEKNLKNVMFLSFLPQNEYWQLLSICDAAFIILNEKMATPNFPSKTLTYFNLQVPIIASIDYVTDYGVFLEKTKTGLWSYSGDVKSFKKNLLKLYNYPDLCNEIKENQIKYFKHHMQPQNAYNAIFNHVRNIGNDAI